MNAFLEEKNHPRSQLNRDRHVDAPYLNDACGELHKQQGMTRV